MAAKRIDGKAVAAERRQAVAADVSELAASGLTPCLAAISVGGDPAWGFYQSRQEKSCANVGIDYRRIDLVEGSNQDDLLECIEGLNADPSIHGIIIQAPLPKPFDLVQAQAVLAPAKDVEGVSPANLGQVLAGREALAPCTARAAVALAEHQLGDLRGVNAVVIGASTIVGKPALQLLVNAGATVNICHIDTRDVGAHTRLADLIIVAVGKPSLLTADMVKPGATVIDVGINQITKEDGSKAIVGDVDPQVWDVAGAVSPVPGGVGSMTTVILLEHTVTAARAQRESVPAIDGSVLARVLGASGVDLPPEAAASIATMVSRHLVTAGSGVSRNTLERRLSQGVLIFDGGVATELIARGIHPDHIPDANIAQPEIVQAVHEDFLTAGADIITANTHNINRFHYSREQVDSLVRAGVRLARLASKGRALVIGSIGPLGRVIDGELAQQEATDAVAEVALAMADAGVDAILCETLPSTAEALAHVRGVRQATQVPVLVSRRYGRDDSRELAEFARAMESAGANAIGLNSVRGPRALVSAVGMLASLTNLPVMARPNAGDPRREGGQVSYHLDPAWLVEQVRDYVARGVRMVGGCSGVGPGHIAAVQAIRSELKPSTPDAAAAIESDDHVPAAVIHPLLSAMTQGAFPVLALLAARLDAMPAEKAAQALTHAGSAGIGLDPGWPGSSGLAGLPARLRYIEDRTQVPSILTLDPWALDLSVAQDILVSAHLLGVRMVLIDSGIFTADADHADGCGPQALLRLIKNLNAGRDAGGTRLDVSTSFASGVRVPSDAIAEAASWKEFGAHFITVQPVYEPKTFRVAIEALPNDIPILAEILVLPDADTADELDNEVPSLSVPARLRQRLRNDPEEDVRGVLRFLASWSERLAGAVLLLPDERTEAAEKVLAGLASLSVDGS